MLCDIYWIYAARTRVLQDMRKVQALTHLVSEVKQMTQANKLPGDPAQAAKVVTAALGGMGAKPNAVTSYDGVDDFVNNCPLGQPLIGDYDCWQNSDVSLRVHFARQKAYAAANSARNYTAVQAYRQNDLWLVIRYGLGVYANLKRINYKDTDLADSVTIATAASAADTDQNWQKTFAAFLTAAGKLSLTGVVPAGLGDMGALISALDQEASNLSDANAPCIDRLDQMAEFQPQHATPWIHRACIPETCPPCGSGSSGGNAGSSL